MKTQRQTCNTKKSITVEKRKFMIGQQIYLLTDLGMMESATITNIIPKTRTNGIQYLEIRKETCPGTYRVKATDCLTSTQEYSEALKAKTNLERQIMAYEEEIRSVEDLIKLMYENLPSDGPSGKAVRIAAKNRAEELLHVELD